MGTFCQIKLNLKKQLELSQSFIFFVKFKNTSVFYQIIGTRSDKIVVSPLSYAAESMRSFNPVLHRELAQMNSRKGQRATSSHYIFILEKHRKNANSLFVDCMLNQYP